MRAGGSRKIGKAVRLATERTSRAGQVTYLTLAVSGRSGIKAMRATINSHLGDAECAEKNYFPNRGAEISFRALSK
jgi:hypothetical protein